MRPQDLTECERKLWKEFSLVDRWICVSGTLKSTIRVRGHDGTPAELSGLK